MPTAKPPPNTHCMRLSGQPLALLLRHPSGRAALLNAGLIASYTLVDGQGVRLSGNPLVAPAMQTHWTQTQRVMGEVLMRDDKPRDIWDQHEALLVAVAAGDAEGAERLARQHILDAATFMIERMRGERSA